MDSRNPSARNLKSLDQKLTSTFAWLSAFWLPLAFASTHEWLHGDYYRYGIFIPFLASWLYWRRLREIPAGYPLGTSKVILPCIVALALIIAALRVLNIVDPLWRLPLWSMAILAGLATHWLIWNHHGSKHSTAVILVTLLWCTAIPWPSAIEKMLVSSFTHQVANAVVDYARMGGHPAWLHGGSVYLDDLRLEISDGCSGIRSFQSFVMASIFFSELLRLGALKSIILLVFGVILAYVINVIRACVLLMYGIKNGAAGIDQAHDPAGLLSFASTAVLFYIFAAWLARAKRVRVVVRHSSNP